MGGSISEGMGPPCYPPFYFYVSWNKMGGSMARPMPSPMLPPILFLHLAWNWSTIMKYYELIWNLMKYYEILWNTMKYDGLLWNTMKCIENTKHVEIKWGVAWWAHATPHFISTFLEIKWGVAWLGPCPDRCYPPFYFYIWHEIDQLLWNLMNK